MELGICLKGEAAGVTQFTLYLMTEERERIIGAYAASVMPHLH